MLHLRGRKFDSTLTACQMLSNFQLAPQGGVRTRFDQCPFLIRQIGFKAFANLSISLLRGLVPGHVDLLVCRRKLTRNTTFRGAAHIWVKLQGERRMTPRTLVVPKHGIRLGTWAAGLALLLVVVAGISAKLVIGACGVILPFPPWAISDCRSPAANQNSRLEDTLGRQAVLEQNVEALEIQLARLRCLPHVVAETITREPARTVPQDEPDEIDERLEREHAQSGELSFSLVWNTTSDLDLYVSCPNGRTIWARNKREENSSCAGELDVDANGGRRDAPTVTRDPVENVYFTRATNGRYIVKVDLFRDRTNNHREDFVVRIMDGGRTLDIPGYVSLERREWRYEYGRNGN